VHRDRQRMVQYVRFDVATEHFQSQS
jgi:hypothetical protein